MNDGFVSSNSVLLYIYLWLYSLLFGLGRFFSFLILHSRYDSLDGGSARHKAATYTQSNTNTDIHVVSQCSNELSKWDFGFHKNVDISLIPLGAEPLLVFQKVSAAYIDFN